MRWFAIGLLVFSGCGTPAAPPVDAGARDAIADAPVARAAPTTLPDAAPAATATAPDLARGACAHGACWVHPQPTGSRITAISGSASLVVAVGEAGTILEWDGRELRSRRSPYPVDLLDVYAEEPGREYAVGADGAVLHRMVLEQTGPEWIAYDCGTTARLRAVHAAPGGPVIVAGDGGLLMHLGNDCPRIPTRVTTTFHDVHVVGSRWFAVASDRVITFGDPPPGETGFRPISTWMAPDGELRSVAAIDAARVFVAGRDGWLASDGPAWRWHDHPLPDPHLFAIGPVHDRRIVSSSGCEIRGNTCVTEGLPAVMQAAGANAVWRGAGGPWWIAREGRLELAALETVSATAAPARSEHLALWERRHRLSGGGGWLPPPQFRRAVAPDGRGGAWRLHYDDHRWVDPPPELVHVDARGVITRRYATGVLHVARRPGGGAIAVGAAGLVLEIGEDRVPIARRRAGDMALEAVCAATSAAWAVGERSTVVAIGAREVRLAAIEPRAELDLVGVACGADGVGWVAARDGTILRCAIDGGAPRCRALPRRVASYVQAIVTVRGEPWVFGIHDEGPFAARVLDPTMERLPLELGRGHVESVDADDDVGAWILTQDAGAAGLLRFDPPPAPARRYVPSDLDRVAIVAPSPHAGSIVGAATDGSRGVTVGSDGTAALHDLTTGEVLASISGLERSTRARVWFERDGTIAIQIGTQRRWSPSDGTLRYADDVRLLPSGRVARHSWARGLEICIPRTGHRWPALCEVLVRTAHGRALEVSRDGTILVGLDDEGIVHVLHLGMGSSSAVRLAGLVAAEARLALVADRWVVVVAGGDRAWIVDVRDGSTRTVETGLHAVTWPSLTTDEVSQRATIDVGTGRAVTIDLARGERADGDDCSVPRAIVRDGEARFRTCAGQRIVRFTGDSLDVDERRFDRDGIVLGIEGDEVRIGPRGATSRRTPIPSLACADARLRPRPCGERRVVAEDEPERDDIAPAVCPRDGPFCVLRREDGSLEAARRDRPEVRWPLAGTENAGWLGDSDEPAIDLAGDGRFAVVGSTEEDDPRGSPVVTVVDVASGRAILDRASGWAEMISPDGRWLVQTEMDSPWIGETFLFRLGVSPQRLPLSGNDDTSLLGFAADSSAFATRHAILSLADLAATPIEAPLPDRIANTWWLGGSDALVLAPDPLDGLHVIGRDGRARGIVPIPTSDEEEPGAPIEALRDRPFLATCDGRDLLAYDVARGALAGRHPLRCPWGGFDWADSVINPRAAPPAVSWDGTLLIQRESRRRSVVTRLADGAWIALQLVDVGETLHAVAIAEDGALWAAPEVLDAIAVRPCGMPLTDPPIRAAELRRRYVRRSLVSDLFAGRPLPRASPALACPPR